MSEILISLLLVSGTIAMLVGALGLVRFPDVFNRMHATGKNTTLGLVGLLVAATIFFSIREGLTLKLLLVVPFLFWTAPAGVFAISHAALSTGTELARETIRNDLSWKTGRTRERE